MTTQTPQSEPVKVNAMAYRGLLDAIAAWLERNNQPAVERVEVVAPSHVVSA